MISICIPSYNRVDMVINSFINIIDDDRIDEIIIVDDFSNIDKFKELSERILKLNNNKIKLFRNKYNVGDFNNKYECVKKSKNEWIILLDSDNKINKNYLDAIPNELSINTIYLPDQGICESNILNYENYINYDIDLYTYKSIVFSNDVNKCY